MAEHRSTLDTLRFIYPPLACSQETLRYVVVGESIRPFVFKGLTVTPVTHRDDDVCVCIITRQGGNCSLSPRAPKGAHFVATLPVSTVDISPFARPLELP